jgi:hypothetical protein
LSQPHFEGSVRSPLTLPKMGLESPLGLPKTQSSIAGVKTSLIGVFFIPLERSWSVDVQNGLAWVIWTSASQVMVKRRAGNQIGSLTPDSGVCRRSATHRWKALKESYKFALDFIPIGGLSKKLWMPKVPGVQTGIVSKLPLGSPETKSHLDVAPVEWYRVYYMGEGGGFLRIRAVVSQVSPKLPVASPSTKGAPECDLTNLLVGLMQVRVSE